MKKTIRLIAIVVLALSIFCISAMAAGADDAQLKFLTRDGVKYLGSNPEPWCTYYTASNGSGKVIYSYINGDTNEDSKTDVCDLVKTKKESLDFDFDKSFSGSDLDLMREIIFNFNPDHPYEIKLDAFQAQMKAEAEAAGAPYEKMNRQLVWHDEFDGNALNTRNWAFEKTMEYSDHEYVRDSEHVRVEDGKLKLSVRKSNETNKVVSVAEGLTTKDNMLFKYGYLEMRAKVPYQEGAWPSFWCTSRTPLQQFTHRMEVDILEVWSSTNSFSANLIKWPGDAYVDTRDPLSIPTGYGWPTLTYVFDNASNLKNEYHTYGFEWDPNYMNIYVDNHTEPFVTFEITGTKAEFKKYSFLNSSFPEYDMFQDWLRININNECFTEKVGHGNNVDTSKLPFEYYIDYVRLYQNRDGGEIFKTTDEITAEKNNK